MKGNLIAGFSRVFKSPEDRALLNNLVKISMLAQYRKSFLGYWWILLQPIFAVLSWLILDKAEVLTPGDMDMPYSLYVIFMSTIWSFFYGTYFGISRIFSDRGEFILQSCINSDVLILERLFLGIINIILPIVLNFALLIGFGVEIKWTAIFLPFAMLPLFLLGWALGLFVNVFRILFHDLIKVVDVAFPLLLFISPVIYVESAASGWAASLIEYNPLTYLLAAARDIVIYGHISNIPLVLGITVASIIMLFVGYRFHVKAEQIVLERILG